MCVWGNKDTSNDSENGKSLQYNIDRNVSSFLLYFFSNSQQGPSLRAAEVIWSRVWELSLCYFCLQVRKTESF